MQLSAEGHLWPRVLSRHALHLASDMRVPRTGALPPAVAERHAASLAGRICTDVLWTSRDPEPLQDPSGAVSPKFVVKQRIHHSVQKAARAALMPLSSTIQRFASVEKNATSRGVSRKPPREEDDV